MELACSICSPFNGVKSGLKCGIYPLVIHSRRKKAFLIEGILKMYENHLLAAMKNDLALEKTSATWSRLLTPTSGLLLFFFRLFDCVCHFPSTPTCSRQLFTYIGLMSWTQQMVKKCSKSVFVFTPHLSSTLVYKKREKKKKSLSLLKMYLHCFPCKWCEVHYSLLQIDAI